MPGRLRVFMKALAIAFLQYVLILIITLLCSFAVNMDPDANALGVVAVLAVTSVVGTVLGGWIGLRTNWLQGDRLLARTLSAAIGAAAVLALGSALGRIYEASPFLTAAMFACIVGFHVPGLWRRHS